MKWEEFTKPELSLLTLEDVQGENKLEVLEKFGLKAELTDLALLTGGIYRGIIHYFLSGSLSKKNKCSYILDSLSHKDNCNYHIDEEGKVTTFRSSWNSVGIMRLCLSLPTYIFDKIVLNKRVLENGVSEVDCGLLPQFSIKEEEQEFIENLYYNKKLEKEKGEYIFLVKDKKYGNMYIEHFEIYIYNNRKYIRMTGEHLYDYEIMRDDPILLSNDKVYWNVNQYAWLELRPVTWLIDEKSKKLISKYGLFTTVYDYMVNNNYLNGTLFEEMFGDVFEKIHNEIINKGRGEKSKSNFWIRFLTWLKNPFGRNTVMALPNGPTPSLLPEASTELAIVPEQPKDIALVEDKKEEKIEINNEEINRLCDYIKEKSLLLVPSKRKDVLERLNQLLDNYKREMEDLDSEMYVKYNLSLTTPEGSKLTLWDGLNRLKLDVDTFLLDNDNKLNYGEEYLIYLRNSISNYQIQEQEKKLELDKSKMDKFVKLLIKIDDEYNKITPYFRDEILGFVFFIIHLFVENDPFYMHIYVGNIGPERNILKSCEILDKLIVWFENWYKDNKDKLDDERQRKYLEIKMTMSMENKFAYIVELARIIDPTLITIKEDKKAR